MTVIVTNFLKPRIENCSYFYHNDVIYNKNSREHNIYVTQFHGPFCYQESSAVKRERFFEHRLITVKVLLFRSS